MEFEVLDEDLEWEAWRLATAFGMPEYQSRIVWGDRAGIFLEGKLSVEIQADKGLIDLIRLQRGFFCELFKDHHTEEYETYDWKAVGETQMVRDLMARALYCLGFEDERVLAELKCLLSAHEKLELRLSMPREFWPKKWLGDEENATK